MANCIINYYDWILVVFQAIRTSPCVIAIPCWQVLGKSHAKLGGHYMSECQALVELLNHKSFDYCS